MDEPQATNHRQWNRREVLIAGGGGALVAVALAACGDSGQRAAAPKAGAPFTQPQELISQDGELAVTLTVEAGQIPFGDSKRFAYTFNGTSPGPTLRVRPGDKVTLTLENQLDEATNLHTHGLHVSPEGDADNVFVTVDPGKSHTYVYEIPSDHRSGLCWYHPHHHGMVARQISAGLFGAIIVEDTLDTIPELEAAEHRLLVLNDPSIGDDDGILDVSRMDTMAGREGEAALVNGLLTPAMTAAAGSLEHWRIVNASPSRYFRLALDDHPLHLIATDGGRLAKPHETDEVLLAPGERVEALVTPLANGSHTLRTLGYNRGAAGMGGGMMGGSGTEPSTEAQALATMVVTGTATAAAALPTEIADASTLDAGTAESERTLTLSMGMGGMGGMGDGGMMSFTINGSSFDAERVDIRTDLGTTEDWILTNNSPMDHPIHLHVWPFRVIERSVGPADPPGWKDTVNVPAGATVRIRIPFTDIAGRTVYHCHILDHEDQGMMGIIEIK